jgi:hypothetical protein
MVWGRMDFFLDLSELPAFPDNAEPLMDRVISRTRSNSDASDACLLTRSVTSVRVGGGTDTGNAERHQYRDLWAVTTGDCL